MPDQPRSQTVVFDDETRRQLADICEWISERGLGVKVSRSHAVRLAVKRAHKQMLAEREGESS